MPCIEVKKWDESAESQWPERIRDWMLLRIGSALALQDTTSTATQNRWASELAAAQQTNSGPVASADQATPSAVIAELRRRSGLTWDELARLFGVARCSVHVWVSGKALNAANEERLGRLLGAFAQTDKNSHRGVKSDFLSRFAPGLLARWNGREGLLCSKRFFSR